MSWLFDLKLIPVFDVYLVVAFIASMAMRIRLYWGVIALVRSFSARWPKLLALLTQHRNLFLTWRTVLPLIVYLVMLLVQMLASRIVWPNAQLKVAELVLSWPALITVCICGFAMIAFDVWGIFDVGQIDRVELEKHFDEAEHWLGTWKAPVVRFFTFGRINPRKMVAEEVRSALLSASEALNYNLRWLVGQTILRLLFGLSLWVSWGWLR